MPKMEDEEAGKHSRVSSGHSNGQLPHKCHTIEKKNEPSSEETEPNSSNYVINNQIEVSEPSFYGHTMRLSTQPANIRELCFATPHLKLMLLMHFQIPFSHHIKSQMRSP